MSERHLDLDELADVLADVLADGSQPPHLQTCASCRARLDELGTAAGAVTATLAALPEPELPPGLDDRLARALAAAGGPADVLPLQRKRAGQRSRWLPALGAVAAAAAVVVGAVVLTRGGGSPSQTADRASGPGYAVNDTGADYTPSALRDALPQLLTGKAPKSVAAPQSFAGAQKPQPSPSQERTTDSSTLAAAPSDALAPLRDTAGLARCLASLTDPSETGLPLALDYASYQGTPALVVVLPSSKADKVDVFVVPPGCAQADGRLLYFTRLPKP